MQEHSQLAAKPNTRSLASDHRYAALRRDWRDVLRLLQANALALTGFALTPLLLLGLALVVASMTMTPSTDEALATAQQVSSSEQPATSPSAVERSPATAVRVAIRRSPATYFEKIHGEEGFEQQLLLSFVNALGLELQLVPFHSVSSMFDALNNGDVDMVSSGYGANPVFLSSFNKGPSYRSDELIAVYRVGQHRPRKLQHLLDKRVAVIANSQASSLLHSQQQQYPQLSWGELPNIDYIDLLSRIESDELDVAIMSKTDFQLYRGAFPKLGEGFALNSQLDYRWVFGNGRFQHELLAEARQFFVSAETQKQLKVLEERFFSPSADINQTDAFEFARNTRKRLPRYSDIIQLIASEQNMDWRFLAAISYQESSWQPNAISPTGVRGMMMLTRNTAREMGISNRLDVENSLRGGAAYYRKLLDRVSPAVTGPDRKWMALAAYNFGYGHLLDARALTAKRGGDPNVWYDVKQTLPLLQQAEYYKTTRYGYARGREALNYVQQIRHYSEVLLLKDFVVRHQAALAQNPVELQPILAISAIDAQADLAANF